MVKYYKIENENRVMSLYDESVSPPANAIEITKSEFTEYKQEGLALQSREQEIRVFGSAVMDFFMDKIFVLTAEQKITLMSIKTYFELNQSFPPMEDMAKAEPDLWAMVVNAVKSGELPPLPEA